MADFNTTQKEEILIERIRRYGLGYENDSDCPKYVILRIALACALKAEITSLDSPQFRALGGEKGAEKGGENGKEYHLEQITNKGKKDEDFDLLIRALLYLKHKDELKRVGCDIFKDEKAYLEILSRYIKKGLFELDCSYKNSDCFFQWCLENLNLRESSGANRGESGESSESSRGESPSSESYEARLKDYCKRLGIGINIIQSADSPRSHNIKMELEDSTKIRFFEKNAEVLDREFGSAVIVEPNLNGESRMYRIQITKDESAWRILGQKELQTALDSLQKLDFELGIFAGIDVENEPFYFDLKAAPHLLVAGTTGSGKTQLLRCFLTCLLQNKNANITVIDPKSGAGFAAFKNRLNLVGTAEASEVLAALKEEMDSRYKRAAAGEKFENMGYEILLVDELADLFMNDKTAQEKLTLLAQKGRECRIHLILATQRPDSATLVGLLRSNIPSRIALKVQKSTESKIILDEVGAEKLSGRGDMLVKLSGKPTRRVFGVAF